MPGKLKPGEVNRTEQLVPLRLEFDVEHHKFRDTFVWNLNGQWTFIKIAHACPVPDLTVP
jgi:hypothetical protein